mmetsp:Transcript_21668/g.65796  ORF Transcript_21668/g.65796 Transcript_21668/m.65796 type:complete len:89 (-) Transcript_21668:2416-2682(-)|eukprot:scaffold17070_cov36-Tisochrysis_lutea.AAC.1
MRTAPRRASLAEYDSKYAAAPPLRPVSPRPVDPHVWPLCKSSNARLNLDDRILDSAVGFNNLLTARGIEKSEWRVQELNFTRERRQEL